MTTTIREFTRTDWYGFGGASRFAGGEEPLIAEMALADGTDYLIIAGGEAVEVMMCAADTDDGDSDTRQLDIGRPYESGAPRLATQAMGRLLMEHILRPAPAGVRTRQEMGRLLCSLGFIRIG